MSDEMRKLTKKQKAFADFFIETGNAAESARRAGYSKKTDRAIGAENLTKPNIKKHIEKKIKKIEEASIANATEVMKYLSSVLRGESKSEIVVVEGTGEGCSEARAVNKAPDEREKLKAAELLGRRYAIFTEKIDMSIVVPVVISGEDSLED